MGRVLGEWRLSGTVARIGHGLLDESQGQLLGHAPTESFFNSLKNERVHGTRYDTRDEAIADVFDYIEPFYNRSRKHSTLGYVSPVKFLENWVSTQHEQKLAA